jgi:Family of unknown function (DUF5996)
LHLYAQIVAKIKLATTTPRNHWWNVPLYVDVRREGEASHPVTDCDA